MSSDNRTIYEAEIADITRAGKQIRIVRRRKTGQFEIESPHYVETMDVEQARELCERLEEAITRA